MTLVVMLLTASTAWAQFSGGDGSENNPYEIASYDDLLTLRNNVNNGERYGNCYFRQTADIDWPDGTTWERGIGYSDTGSHYFRGRYDGNGKKITGFRLTTSEQNAGLFGYVLGDYRGTDATNNVIAEVKNVVLVDPVITAQATSGEQYVGTLVGYVSRCVKIDDNTVIGGSVTITGVSNNDNSVYAGGLVGYYFNGDWPSLKRNIVSGTTVSGAGVSGGLVGRLYYSYCVDQNFVDATVSSVQHTSDAGTFYRQGAVVGECYSISNNSSYFTWGYYHNTAGLTFFAKDENGNTKNDQPKTSRIYAVGIVPSDITVSGDGYHGFCGKHYCLSGASITLSGGTAPAGYLLNGYTSTDATITNGIFTMPAKDITVSATFTPDPAHIEQTATDEYTIHSAEGWGVFCDMLQDNATYNRFIGKTVKLDANIGTAENPITRMAGSSGHEFFGTFDGQQHTLTFSYGATGAYGNEQYVAPFRYVSGDNEQNPAIIQNLHVTGHIYTSTKYATGILAQQNGTVKIKNCHSSIVIHSSVSGDGSHGGLVGGISGTLSIDGCVFDGKLLTTGTTATNNCGGFVGWNGGTLTISNSLYAPAIIDTEHGEKEVVVGTSYPSATFSRNGATITNSYYTRTLGTAQGKQARTITAGDYVTIEAVSPIGSPVENGTYSVSGITAYAKGITRGDAFYYGNGDEVSLTLSHADRGGYTFTGYTASAGTLDGTTLTMPDQNVTITANYELIKFTQGALSYECTSGTEVKVTACDKSATSVTIPTTVTYDEVTYSVTAIDVNAFADCTSLKCIIMESATPLALASSMVFNSCTALNTIAVPSEAVDAYKAATNWSTYASKILTLDGACGDGVYWSYNSDSKKLTIFGTGAMESHDFFYQPWSSYSNEITKVVIREGVTTIGNLAFSRCYALSSIELPTSLTTILEKAFEACSSLTSITIPASVTRIDSYAFARCYGLSAFVVDNGNTAYAAEDGVLFNKDKTTLHTYPIGNNRDTYTIPASVTRIASYAFAYCTSLTTVFMQLTTPPTLGNDVFENCDELANIYVPAGTAETYKTTGNWATYKDIIQTGGACGDDVYWSYNSTNKTLTIFGEGTMEDYSNGNQPWYSLRNDIETVDIRAGVTSISNYAFSFCNLSSINIPASVMSIGDWAFNTCDHLTSINIPTSVTTIGGDAFGNCIRLSSINIPASVTSIGDAAFLNCYGLVSISVAEGNTVYDSHNGCNALIETASNTLIQGCKNTVIPNTVTSIGDVAFLGCEGLTSITIPASVTSIGQFAFNGCYALTSITIPASVTSIGDYAFQNCTSLTTVFMERTTPPTLGNIIFNACKALDAIYVPAASLDDYKTAWADYASKIQGYDGTCGDDVYWSYNSTSHKLTIFGTGAMADYYWNNRPWFSFRNDITTVDIRNGVTTIGDYAFQGCEDLEEIMIPAGVTTIGNEAFQDCGDLTSIEIPASVASIGDAAFQNCRRLSSIDLPASVTSIGGVAFNGCTALGSITVASGNTIYDSRNDCNALIETASNTLIQGCVNTVIPNTVTSIGSGAFYECFDLKEITIPASVTTIGGDAFAFCKDLTSIEIPASVTTIGDGAFDVCEGLTSITISEGVTSIGDAAFAGCTSLTNITIPASVTSIGDYAFQECTGLTTVFMVSTTPPTLGYIVFNVCKALDAIYVPTDKVDDYKTAWADYKDKIKGLDEITEIALADNASNSDLIAAVNGQTHNVTLQGRTLVKDGNWNTLCLPFDVDLTDTESPLYGATVKKLNASASGLSGSTLTLAFEAETTTLHAGVPYIIKWTETGDNITNPKFTGVTISSTEPTPVTSTDGKVTFVGQYSPFEIVESGATGDNQGNKNEIIMLSSGNKLGYSKNPRTLHTFRCHFYIPTNDSQQQARSFVLDFGEGETTTGIISMSDGRSQMSDGWYDLQGRKLDKQPAKKGLYIMNGKKVKR